MEISLKYFSYPNCLFYLSQKIVSSRLQARKFPRTHVQARRKRRKRLLYTPHHIEDRSEYEREHDHERQWRRFRSVAEVCILFCIPNGSALRSCIFDLLFLSSSSVTLRTQHFRKAYSFLPALLTAVRRRQPHSQL